MARLGLVEINDSDISFVEENVSLCKLVAKKLRTSKDDQGKKRNARRHGAVLPDEWRRGVRGSVFLSQAS
jgi:hypothetical protein